MRRSAPLWRSRCCCCPPERKRPGAQGVAAVATVLLPVAVFVLSGRAQRRVRALLRCRLSKQPPVLYSSSDGGSSPGHSPGTGNEDGAGAPLLSPDGASSEDPLPWRLEIQAKIAHRGSSWAEQMLRASTLNGSPSLPCWRRNRREPPRREPCPGCCFELCNFCADSALLGPHPRKRRTATGVEANRSALR